MVDYVNQPCEFLAPYPRGGTRKFGIKCAFLLEQTVINSNSKFDGTFLHVLVFNISLFSTFLHIGPLKIRHGLYILCLKITLQRTKLNFEGQPVNGMMLKTTCPVKFGVTERELGQMILAKRNNKMGASLQGFLSKGGSYIAGLPRATRFYFP